jgi:UPF0042 nucleotide-binding protein
VQQTEPIQVVIITGLSGSGRSTAIHALEDLGFFCVDNLPLALIPPFLDLCRSSKEGIKRIGFGIDVRERFFLEEYPKLVDQIKGQGCLVEVLFLDAADDVLIRRYSETRRPHPVGKVQSIRDAITMERKRLERIRDTADQIIDTSFSTVHELKEELLAHFTGLSPSDGMSILILSFGYRYGVPPESDIVLDVRFLPNPYFVQNLRGKSGTDPEVSRFVLDRDETREYLSHVMGLLDYTLPLFEKEKKSYLTVSLGCTGGVHRSVALAEELRRILEEKCHVVRTKHRDIER